MSDDYLEQILSSVLKGDEKESKATPAQDNKNREIIIQDEAPAKQEKEPLQSIQSDDSKDIVLFENDLVKIVRNKSDPLPTYNLKVYDIYENHKKEIDAIVSKFYGEDYLTKRAFSSLDEIKEVVKDIATKMGIKNVGVVSAAAQFISNKIRGYSYLQPFLDDDDLEEVMVNGLNVPVFVYHRKFKMCKTNLVFTDEKEVVPIIEKIARETGRRVDQQVPILDAYLKDGSRVNATLPPISPDGPTITIRKFKKDPLTIIDLIRFGSISADAAAFLWLAVDGLGAKPANILVSGGTGSGKTTLLNSLSLFIPPTDRVITIEDTLELQLTVEHWVRLQTRPPNIEGTGEVSMDTLLKNTLRMRPDRLIVGEVRGPEAVTLFTAMNTGHDGCMGTIHANSARETLTRITTPPMSVPGIMVQALDFIVVSKRFNLVGKGIVRRVIEIAEVAGAEGGRPTMSTLFKYDSSIDSLVKTDVASRYLSELANAAGITQRELLTSIEERAIILMYLAEKDIRDIKSVGEYMKMYYVDKDKLLDMIESDVNKNV